MRRRLRLARMRLRYADGMVLHTATSGAVPVLDELRLTAEEGGALVAIGATRINIEYLSGLAPEALVEHCVAVARALDWRLPWHRLVAALDARFPALPAPARMLFEMAAADGAARTANVPLAIHLGGEATAAIATNQTLFYADMETILSRAHAYLARGFRDLKLRVGSGPIAEDVARLRRLRAHLGPDARLSADANGRWDVEEILPVLPALAAIGLAYIEQPLAAGAWDAAARLTAASPVPVMLDESLADEGSIARLIATRAASFAHLKLAKLGGLDRLVRAGRFLHAAGLRVMVGQMNEGSVSTLAAAHAAAAIGADLAELYGADGLASDPAGLLRYEQGLLHLLPGPGLGIAASEEAGDILWKEDA
jgi:L-alanine-DL-glutamate epimerase-like enolase superfamily enzyme